MSNEGRVSAVDKRIYGGKSDVNQLTPIVYKTLWQSYLDANTDHWGLNQHKLTDDDKKSLGSWIKTISTTALRARYLCMTAYRMTSAPEYRQYILRAIDELTVNVEMHLYYFGVDSFSGVESGLMLSTMDGMSNCQENFTKILHDLISDEIAIGMPDFSVSPVADELITRVRKGVLARAATHYTAYETMVNENGEAAGFNWHTITENDPIVHALDQIKSRGAKKTAKVVESLDWD